MPDGNGKVTYNADQAMREATGMDGTAIAPQLEGKSLGELQKSLTAAMQAEGIDLDGTPAPTPEPEAKPVEKPAEDVAKPEPKQEADTSPDPVAEKLAKLEKQIAEQDLYNRRVASENGELKKKLNELSNLPPAEQNEADEIDKKRYLDLIDDDKKFEERQRRLIRKEYEVMRKADLERQAQEISGRTEKVMKTKTLIDQAMPDLAQNLEGIAQAALEAGATPEQANFIKSHPYESASSMTPEMFKMLYVAGKAYSKLAGPANGGIKKAGEGKINLGSLGRSAGKNGASTRETVQLTQNRLANMSLSDKKVALAKQMRDENIL